MAACPDEPNQDTWEASGKLTDLYVVSRVDMEEGELAVDFDGRRLDELVLAYATTIHKSQGSEYPAVVIPLTTQR